MVTHVPKRDQRLNLSNLTRVQLEHCKKLDLLIFFLFWGFFSLFRLKNPTNQPNHPQQPNTPKVKTEIIISEKSFCTGCIKNITLCQKLSGV